jgi:hypothetical protein
MKIAWAIVGLLLLASPAWAQKTTEVNTELPAATAQEDGVANPTVPGVRVYVYCWDDVAEVYNRCLGSPDPCQTKVKLTAMIDQTSGEQVITGTASTRTFICSIQLMSATSQSVAVVSGTGSVCATSVGPLLGGTTAATGWGFAAGGHIEIGNGSAWVAKTDTDADNVCVLQSSSGQVSGNITYVPAAN